MWHVFPLNFCFIDNHLNDFSISLKALSKSDFDYKNTCFFFLLISLGIFVKCFFRDVLRDTHSGCSFVVVSFFCRVFVLSLFLIY